jgi:hypothetical protein
MTLRLVISNLIRRGTQVVRERSAKPLCVGSIPTRASSLLKESGVIAQNSNAAFHLLLS